MAVKTTPLKMPTGSIAGSGAGSDMVVFNCVVPLQCGMDRDRG